MKLKNNTFKRAIYEKKLQYGLWLGLPDSLCAEICAGAGYDWLVIDAEHAPFDNHTILTHLQTIAAYPVHPIVRVVSDDRNIIKQVLDLGAQTILVPMIESVEQAKELVRSVRYAPDGVRGIGTALARAAHWNEVPDYLHRANDEICLVVQVETSKGIENLQEIAQVEGVDAVFIGPSDLAASLGYIGDGGHEEVVNTINEAIRVIVNTGKAAGILALDPERAQEFIKQGVSFVGIGADTLLLTTGAKSLLENFKNP